MSARPDQLSQLSRRLWDHGVAAFCPTTLSMRWPALEKAVARIGEWIRTYDPGSPGTASGAIPLGIHLEGPYLHGGACGAHRPDSIRPFRMKEIETLWQVSSQTLKRITLAPENLSASQLRELSDWAKTRQVSLSLGHSLADESLAHRAFENGVTGVTHAWNALPFHHRTPGALGAAIGRKGVSIELIPDEVHVSPTVIRWTLALHPQGVCFVSDSVPATGVSSGLWQRFGNLKIHRQGRVCRLANGQLAGGGMLLSESYCRWLSAEARRTGISLPSLLRSTLACVTSHPLQALGLSSRILSRRRVHWEFRRGQIHIRPARPLA